MFVRKWYRTSSTISNFGVVSFFFVVSRIGRIGIDPIDLRPVSTKTEFFDSGRGSVGRVMRL
jgi:hypothetical protein